MDEGCHRPSGNNFQCYKIVLNRAQNSWNAVILQKYCSTDICKHQVKLILPRITIENPVLYQNNKKTIKSSADFLANDIPSEILAISSAWRTARFLRKFAIKKRFFSTMQHLKSTEIFPKLYPVCLLTYVKEE